MHFTFASITAFLKLEISSATQGGSIDLQRLTRSTAATLRSNIYVDDDVFVSFCNIIHFVKICEFISPPFD